MRPRPPTFWQTSGQAAFARQPMVVDSRREPRLFLRLDHLESRRTRGRPKGRLSRRTRGTILFPRGAHDGARGALHCGYRYVHFPCRASGGRNWTIVTALLCLSSRRPRWRSRERQRRDAVSGLMAWRPGRAPRGGASARAKTSPRAWTNPFFFPDFARRGFAPSGITPRAGKIGRPVSTVQLFIPLGARGPISTLYQGRREDPRTSTLPKAGLFWMPFIRLPSVGTAARSHDNPSPSDPRGRLRNQVRRHATANRKHTGSLAWDYLGKTSGPFSGTRRHSSCSYPRRSVAVVELKTSRPGARVGSLCGDPSRRQCERPCGRRARDLLNSFARHLDTLAS